MPAFKKALKEGLLMSGERGRVPKEIIADKSILREARRADDFTKMAVLAAHDAFVDSGLSLEVRRSLGIIVATGLGPHLTTFRFLDDILTYGDKGVSPTLFSHSVHNAAASYIASNLEIRGPTLTVTQFADSFRQGLIIAESWLKEKRCEYILVGSVDQLGREMEYILSAKAPEIIPQEGSVFFLVTEKGDLNKYSSVSALAQQDESISGFSLAASAFKHEDKAT